MKEVMRKYLAENFRFEENVIKEIRRQNLMPNKEDTRFSIKGELTDEIRYKDGRVEIRKDPRETK